MAGVAYAVTVLLGLHTTFGVDALSTTLKLYIVFVDGLTKSVVPEPIDAPAHDA
jgi:hypothetical protein